MKPNCTLVQFSLHRSPSSQVQKPLERSPFQLNHIKTVLLWFCFQAFIFCVWPAIKWKHGSPYIYCWDTLGRLWKQSERLRNCNDIQGRVKWRMSLRASRVCSAVLRCYLAHVSIPLPWVPLLPGAPNVGNPARDFIIHGPEIWCLWIFRLETIKQHECCELLWSLF